MSHLNKVSLIEAQSGFTGGKPKNRWTFGSFNSLALFGLPNPSVFLMPLSASQAFRLIALILIMFNVFLY